MLVAWRALNIAKGGGLVSAAGEMIERGIVVISLAIASLASGKSQPTGPWLLLASGAGLALLALCFGGRILLPEVSKPPKTASSLE